jgi:hypothetical protein
MPRSSIEGWETDFTAYASIGSALPNFSGPQSGGPDLTQEALRERWTILGFASFDTDSDAEIRFVTALNSAVDQDPDLDLLQVYRADTNASAARVTPWPSLADDGTIAALFGVNTTPTYLLIGPDLTIEGYRGALSKTPDDGIKSVIRGIAEIRKQVTAPQ